MISLRAVQWISDGCVQWCLHCAGLIASSTCSTSISTNNTYVRNPGYRSCSNILTLFWWCPFADEIKIHLLFEVPKLLHPGQHRQLCLHHQQGQRRRLPASSWLWGDFSLQHIFSIRDDFFSMFFGGWFVQDICIFCEWLTWSLQC